MSYPNKLAVGARREVFARDGRGGGEWVVATAVEFQRLYRSGEEADYVWFRLDRPGPARQRIVSVKMEPASVGTAMRPIKQRSQ